MLLSSDSLYHERLAGECSYTGSGGGGENGGHSESVVQDFGGKGGGGKKVKREEMVQENRLHGRVTEVMEGP